MHGLGQVNGRATARGEVSSGGGSRVVAKVKYEGDGGILWSARHVLVGFLPSLTCLHLLEVTARSGQGK